MRENDRTDLKMMKKNKNGAQMNNFNNSTSQQFNTSTSDGVAIRVDHVSKKYCKSLKRSMLYGVKDIARNTLGLSSHSENLQNTNSGRLMTSLLN